MTSSTVVSSFFSRDAFLKRQPRTIKQRPNTNVYTSPSSPKSSPLHIIQEEDEPCSSSLLSISPPTPYAPSVSPGSSQTLGLKARRRHASVTVSDIRDVKATIHNENDILGQHFTLISAPRPAPLPPTTLSQSRRTVSSPNPFHLTFTDIPSHPSDPISLSSSSPGSRFGSESPTPSMYTSDASTSPDSQSTCLPTTPTFSDAEFPSYYSSAWPSFNARRASIKPLVINKFNQPIIVDNSNLSFSPDQPSQHSEVHQPQTASSRSEGHTSDDESDSEWYTREFSKILTLCSPLPPSFPQKSRPESTVVPNHTAPEPTNGLLPGFLSTQLDPSFPRRRSNMSRYPPPSPLHLRSHSATSFAQTLPKSEPKSRAAALSLRRPPPRSSVPADCVFFDSDASCYTFSDDSASGFSVSMYDTLPTPTSAQSMYSQPSPFPASFPSTPSSFPESTSSQEFDFDVADIQFAIADADNWVMTLPSLLGSPTDLEADIASGLEELRLRDSSHDDAFIASPSTNTTAAGSTESQRVLRSKWSMSSIDSSIREEHALRRGSSKLRAHITTDFHNSPKSRTFPPSSKELDTPLTPKSPSTKRTRHSRREMYTYTHTKKDFTAYSNTNRPDVGAVGYEKA